MRRPPGRSVLAAGLFLVGAVLAGCVTSRPAQAAADRDGEPELMRWERPSPTPFPRLGADDVNPLLLRLPAPDGGGSEADAEGLFHPSSPLAQSERERAERQERIRRIVASFKADGGAAPTPTQAPRPRLPASTVVPLEEAYPDQARPEPSPAAPLPAAAAAPAALPPTPARPRSHVVGRGETFFSIARRYGLAPTSLARFNPQVTNPSFLEVGGALTIPTVAEELAPAAAPAAPAPTPLPAPRPVAAAPARPTQPPARPVVPTPAPVAPRPTATPAPLYTKCVVQPGETLWSVARRYGATVTNLMLLNKLGEASSVKAGQELIVPVGAVPAGAPAVSPSTPPPPPPSLSPPSAAPSPGTPSATRWHVVAKGDSLFRISRRYGVSAQQLLLWNALGDKHIPLGTRLAVSQPGPGEVPAASPARSPATAASASPTPTPPPAPAPAQPGVPAFVWPLRGEVLKTFGWWDGQPHTGVDIKANLGDPVRAAAAGKVIFSDEMRGYGSVVIVDHADGHFTVYGNNQVNLVRKGAAVARGDVLARVGAGVEGPEPHLHFEVRFKNKAINPLKLLPY